MKMMRLTRNRETGRIVQCNKGCKLRTLTEVMGSERTAKYGNRHVTKLSSEERLRRKTQQTSSKYTT